jgi:predicted RNA binding protein YcfA (HicA-like mRNA interferase family)
MKSKEFHLIIQSQGWLLIRISGSHYIYSKNGLSVPVPFHGSKEISKGLEMKLRKLMKIK